MTKLAIALAFIGSLAIAAPALADTTYRLPAPCTGYMIAHTPYFDSFTSSVVAVGDFHCDQYQSAHPFKLSLWYYYASAGTWGQANSIDETMTGYDDGASVSQCAAYDPTLRSWKTRVNWGGGYAAENVVSLHYKKTC